MRREREYNLEVARAAAAPFDATSPEARRLAAAILEVLAGVHLPGDAARALGLSVACAYELELRAVAGLVAACAAPPPARPRGGHWRGGGGAAVGVRAVVAGVRPLARRGPRRPPRPGRRGGEPGLFNWKVNPLHQRLHQALHQLVTTE